MQFSAVRNKRQSIIGDQEEEASIDSSARRKEIDRIKEMLAKGEARPGQMKRIKYERIDKPFKKMTPQEKKLHIKFLWSRVRQHV